METTLSVLRACTGGYVGAGSVHPALVDAAREAVSEARERGEIHDGYVARCGGDLALVLLHAHPPGSSETVRLGSDAFARCGAVGARLAQHGASENGGPRLSVTELGFTARPSEPLVCFLAVGALAGSWNLPLYRIFADPFTTPGLLRDERMSPGFRFGLTDRTTGGVDHFLLPEDQYALLGLAGTSDRYVVTSVDGRASRWPAAVASADDADATLIVRCEDGLPRVGEALEAFAFPHAVHGWLGGDHVGPLMPVSVNDDATTRFDGPPRVIGLGFQIADRRLVGPRDLLGDRAFDGARRRALDAADYLRRHGPFAPHRSGAERSTPAATHVL